MTHLAPENPHPVAPLDYSFPAQRGRPGIITAMGVMSIIVGCLSTLGGLSGILSGAAYLMMSRAPMPTVAPAPLPTPAPATVPAAPAPAPPAAATSVWVGPGGTTTTTTTATATTAVVIGNPFGGISPAAAILSSITSLLGLGLGIYLLVIGILTLRDSPRAATLHWWYVVLKIPLVIVSTAVGLWMTSGMMKGMAAAMPAGPGGAPPPVSMMGIMAISAIMGMLFALAYPVALIFVLRSRTVRGHYNAVRDAAA